MAFLLAQQIAYSMNYLLAPVHMYFKGQCCHEYLVYIVPQKMWILFLLLSSIN